MVKYILDPNLNDVSRAEQLFWPDGNWVAEAEEGGQLESALAVVLRSALAKTESCVAELALTISFRVSL